MDITKNKKRIVILDDESSLLEMYRKAFQVADFEVFVATNAEEGIKVAGEVKPDIILSDVVMPGGDGFAFLAKAKEDPVIQKIPIVVFTQLDNMDDQREAIELGAKEYLVKNKYTPSEIVTRVSRFIK